MEFKVIINNCPSYAKDYAYIIARVDGTNLWFYGAFNDEEKALRIQRELGDGSVIISNENIK